MQISITAKTSKPNALGGSGKIVRNIYNPQLLVICEIGQYFLGLTEGNNLNH
jgi:hypothetical protein